MFTTGVKHTQNKIPDKPECGYLSSLKIKSKKSDNIDVANLLAIMSNSW